MILIKKYEKVTKKFKVVNYEDVINKSYLDSKLSKTEGQISSFEKDFNEFKLQNNKQSIEEFLIRRAVETKIPILYDRGFFDGFSNTDEVFKGFLFITKRKRDLEEVIDNVVIQWFCS